MKRHLSNFFVMRIPRFYKGKFDPMVDIPVNPENQALTLARFASLPIEVQRDILAKGHQLGDPGIANPDIDFVPPMCRKGVTMAQLLKMFKRGDESIKAGVNAKKRDAIIEKELEAAQKAAEVSSKTN